jgi:hypothetical protein
MRVIFKDAVKALSWSPFLQKILGNEASVSNSFGATELPGGSPFSLCEVSRPTDLFEITSVELTQQPVYMCVILVITTSPIN